MSIDLDAIKKRLEAASGMIVNRESVRRQVSEMYDALADTPRDEHYDKAFRQCQEAENRAWAKFRAQEIFMGHARGDVSELVDEVDRLRAENARLRRGFEAVGFSARRDLLAAIKRGGYDISPCRECGEDVVTVPDGLSCLCEECQKKEEVRG